MNSGKHVTLFVLNLLIQAWIYSEKIILYFKIHYDIIIQLSVYQMFDLTTLLLLC